jgi:glycine betaine/choline ABC-type transport system substrate-binding protein
MRWTAESARVLHLIRAAACALLVAAALLAGACGEEERNPGSAQPQGARLRITLGTQEFPEARILGELWRQALAVNGYTVDLRKGIGPTEDLDTAVRAGEIDGHPAYTGTSLSIVFGEEVSGLDPEGTYREVKALYERRGMAVSEMTPFENVDAIATTDAFAQQEGLKEIRDLRKLKSFAIGARPEFEDLYLGLKGLQQVYGLTNAKFKPITLGAQYIALDEGDVEAANVFTTDPQLETGDYTVLEDTELLFGSQNAVMVVDAQELERIGREEFLRVVDAVNRRLTRDVIVEMNAAVTQGQDDGEVARRFLREVGLLQRPLGSDGD